MDTHHHAAHAFHRTPGDESRGVAQGDLGSALLALSVLMGRTICTLEALLLLWLILPLLPLLLVVTLLASGVLHRCTPAAALRGRLRLGAGG